MGFVYLKEDGDENLVTPLATRKYLNCVLLTFIKAESTSFAISLKGEESNLLAPDLALKEIPLLYLEPMAQRLMDMAGVKKEDLLIASGKIELSVGGKDVDLLLTLIQNDDELVFTTTKV